MTAIAITGTDTGVGKTVITASLVRRLILTGYDAIPIKPFASGIDHATRWIDNDPLLLESACDHSFSSRQISPVQLKLPLSPYDAARLAKSEFDIEAIADYVKQQASLHEYSIIEGIGGVNVPLTSDFLYRDFLARLDMPTIVVTRTRLGTINHTLLTLESLAAVEIEMAGLIFISHNSETLDLEEEAAIHTISRISRLPMLGVLSHQPKLAASLNIDEWVQNLPCNEEPIRLISEKLIAG